MTHTKFTLNPLSPLERAIKEMHPAVQNEILCIGIERDRLKASNTELLAALQKFTAAMDMHLGHNHEEAICEADNIARTAISKATETT